MKPDLKIIKSIYAMELYGTTESEALTMMKDTDKKRAVNYYYHTGQKWGETKNYAICQNSSILGYEECVAVIKGVICNNK